MDNKVVLSKMIDIFYADQRIRVEFIDMIGGLFYLWAGPTPWLRRKRSRERPGYALFVR